MDTAAIIVAAGRGSRAGGDLPKQWRPLAGRRVADWTLDAFRTALPGAPLVVVLHPDDMTVPLPPGVLRVAGGATRDASVRAGLAALEAQAPRNVLVHDIARPCVTADLIARVVAALDGVEAAAPGLAVTDALWSGRDGVVEGARDRAGLCRAQTPQGFRFAPLLAAHAAHGGGAADDVEVARAAGLEVAIVAGDEDNIKITGPADFARAEAILRARQGRPAAVPDIRLGNGYDVHAFGPGDAVTLCGVRVTHDRGLVGHSDADVGMHAITDALYGALAEGDIGRHFPPSDPQWKGAASEIFLAHAAELARARGYAIGNIDCTLICERPKIGPHASDMQAEISRICGIEPGRVSVKATTSERLGFTGREEGIAAVATAVIARG